MTEDASTAIEKGQLLQGAAFERHAKQSVHFFSLKVPPKLRSLLSSLPSGARVVDVGCGDGHLVWALQNCGCLPQGVDVCGVDCSHVRVQRFQELTGRAAILADGTELHGVPDSHADLCISTMVMEHIADDAGYARALARVTRPGGWLYLTTVLRKPGAWYFRKTPDGRRVLDPTHVREYGSVKTVEAVLSESGWQVIECGLRRLAFPLAHPMVRALNVRRPMRDVQRLFLKRPWSWLEKAVLPIPRYREIELVLHRVGAGWS